MSFAVFWNLLGAGLLLLFVPQITSSWGQMKLLGLFAGLCTLAFCLIFVFVPETTGKTLEEINYICESTCSFTGRLSILMKRQSVFQPGNMLHINYLRSCRTLWTTTSYDTSHAGSDIQSQNLCIDGGVNRVLQSQRSTRNWANILMRSIPSILCYH